MLYCPGPGWVLHALGVVQSPWNMLSGVRFSCTTKSCPKKAAYGFVDNSTGSVQPYLDIVNAYGWGNYMFQTNQGPSYPAHQFLYGATSAPSTDDDHSGIFVAENTPKGAGGPDAPPRRPRSCH